MQRWWVDGAERSICCDAHPLQPVDAPDLAPVGLGKGRPPKAFPKGATSTLRRRGSRSGGSKSLERCLPMTADLRSNGISGFRSPQMSDGLLKRSPDIHLTFKLFVAEVAKPVKSRHLEMDRRSHPFAVTVSFTLLGLSPGGRCGKWTGVSGVLKRVASPQHPASRSRPPTPG